MNRRIAEIQEMIAAALNALPGVFSTVQWGGRAYKVGTPKKFKLLAHVCLTREEDAVDLGFKLPKARALAVLDQHEWIKRHSFRTLASSGWLEVKVGTKAQAKVIAGLLKESRGLHPMPEVDHTPVRRGKRASNSESEIVVRRLNSVVAAKRAEGWRPAPLDSFDD